MTARRWAAAVIVLALAGLGAIAAGGGLGGGAAPCAALAQADEAERTVRFAVMGHLYPVLRTATFAREVEDMKHRGYDAVFLAGDLVLGDDYERDYALLKGLFAPLPIVAVPGNHDVDSGGWNGGADREALAAQFERLLNPLHGVRREGDCLFVWLNTNAETRPFNVDQQQSRYLERVLAEDSDARHKFVIVHHRPWAFSDEDPNPHFKASDWMERVHPIIERAGVTHVFAGDKDYLITSRAGGVRYLTAGFPKPGTTREYTYFDVTVRAGAVQVRAVRLFPEDVEDVWGG